MLENILFVLLAVAYVYAAPDLVVDNVRLLKSLWIEERVGKACEIKEGCIVDSDTPRLLLRFDALIWNLGDEDFVIGYNRSNKIWDACHQHWHDTKFAKYVLVCNDTLLATSRKQGYNIQNTDCLEGYSNNRFSQDYQGISVGCGDLYPSDIDCQFLDVTDIYGTAGECGVGVYVNPEGVYGENNYTNNNRVIILPAWDEIPREPPLGYSFWTYRTLVLWLGTSTILIICVGLLWWACRDNIVKVVKYETL